MRTCRSENFFSSSRVRLERGGVLVGCVGEEWGGFVLGGGLFGDGRESGWGEVPLLDFVEAGEEGDGDEDHDCFFAVADFELGEG